MSAQAVDCTSAWQPLVHEQVPWADISEPAQLGVPFLNIGHIRQVVAPSVYDFVTVDTRRIPIVVWIDDLCYEVQEEVPKPEHTWQCQKKERWQAAILPLFRAVLSVRPYDICRVFRSLEFNCWLSELKGLKWQHDLTCFNVLKSAVKRVRCPELFKVQVFEILHLFFICSLLAVISFAYGSASAIE